MSATSQAALPSRFSQQKLILMELDVANATRLITAMADDVKTVLFFDGYYALCSKHIESRGGEVIKYMGDACLAIFPEDAAVDAIDACIAIREDFPAHCTEHGVVPTDIHGTVHIGEVIVGTFGPQGFRDVLGRAPNALFTMAGQGIKISEQVYRKLPSDQRSRWKKRAGPVVYMLTQG